MHPTMSKPCLRNSAHGRRGGAPWALAFWLLAGALFALPFVRDPDAPSYVGDDWRRAEEDYTFEENVAYVEEELGIEILASLQAASDSLFDPQGELLTTSGFFDAYRLESGKREYALHCGGCHGDTGAGDGPAARHLAPRPRNFRKGIFKFTSTANGEAPLRSDLMRVIRDGLAGASMPSFRLITQEVRLDLVEYVRYLSIRGEFEELYWQLAWDDGELPDAELVQELVLRRWDPTTLRPTYPSVSEPPYDEASIERGREMFADAGVTSCFTCHGMTGRGDGPTAGDYTDAWGYPIVPRDLTSGVFRSGAASENLYRAISTGINGTPMGSFGDVLTGEQIWDLVHFVQDLGSDENTEAAQ